MGKTRTPFACVVNGIWWEYFQVDKTLDSVSFRYTEDAYNLPRCSVVVFVNASPDHMPPGKLDELREFVRQGGGLVVLGGFSAYGNSNYQNYPPLVDLLPVDLLKNNGYVSDNFVDVIPTAPKGARLAPAPQADWKMPYDFQSGAMAYYFHSLVPINGAKVQVKVGDQPAFVTGTFGKGRVVACSLTVNGEPAAGQTPFWEWKDWPKLLGQAIEWAAAERPPGTKIVKPQDPTLKPLTDEEIRTAETELETVSPDFVKRAVANPNEKIVKILMEFAAPAKGEPRCGLETVLPAVLPYAKPDWAPRLKPLLEKTNPNFESYKAALNLLGACRVPEAYDILVKALDDEKLQLSAIDGLGRLGDERVIPILKAKFAAVQPKALPDDSDRVQMPFWWRSSNSAQKPDRYDPAPFATGAPVATYTTLALYRLGDPDAVLRLCTLARNLDFYHWVYLNACNRAPRDPNGIAILQALMKSTETLANLEDYLSAGIAPIPPAQADAFVKYAVTVDDSMMIEFVVAAMEKSAGKMTKPQWQAFSAAKSGIVVKMGQALANE